MSEIRYYLISNNFILLEYKTITKFLNSKTIFRFHYCLMQRKHLHRTLLIVPKQKSYTNYANNLKRYSRNVFVCFENLINTHALDKISSNNSPCHSFRIITAYIYKFHFKSVYHSHANYM